MSLTVGIFDREIRFDVVNIKDPDFLKSLECSLCLRTFVNPVITQCQHNYCFECLKNYIDNMTTDDILKCALCRHPFKKEDIKKNLILNTILSTIIVKCCLNEEKNMLIEVEESPLKKLKKTNVC